MQAFFYELNRELNGIHKIFSRVEGNTDCFNDVIVFRRPEETKAKFNLIFFGGDVQDYEEEMKKSITSRNFSLWNLVNTGNLLYKKFASKPDTLANVFIFRADYFHLKTFANYSNFVPSTDFGVPINPNKPNEFAPKLDSNDDDESSNSSISNQPVSSESENKLRCWQHTQKLLNNVIQENNRQHESDKIDENLPIILCGFSKGCIVLNQLCNEIIELSSLTTTNSDADEQDRALVDLRSRLRHFIWLDGGHSGSSNGWIVDEAIVETLKRLAIVCYLYTTPYQMKSPKSWAIEEYERFCALIDKCGVVSRKIYYFQDKEDDYDIDVHFDVLKEFDSNLIID